MIKIGIIGERSYMAGELCRLLFNHPETEIVFVYSPKHKNQPLTDVYEGLYGETYMRFTDELPFDEVDVVFFCLKQGQSRHFLTKHYIPADIHIIDFAPDFRPVDEENDYAYGLPELNRAKIINALHVANPGDFATCIQLGLLPLAESGLLRGDLFVHAVTGFTRDNTESDEENYYSRWNCNFSIFDNLEKDQIDEIEDSLNLLQQDYCGDLNLIPYRGSFSRGLFATISLKCDTPIEEIESYYHDFYSEAPFTHYISSPIDLKQAVNTNKCLIHAERYRNLLIVNVCLDNLLKGASGQAVQNMNLMFGLEETTGLRLKASAY